MKVVISRMSFSFLEEQQQIRLEKELIEERKRHAFMQDCIRNSPMMQRLYQPTPEELRLEIVYQGFDIRWVHLALWTAFSMAALVDCFLFNSWFLRNMSFNLYPVILISFLETIAILFGFLKIAELGYGIGKIVFERLKKAEICDHEKSVLHFSNLPHRDTSLRNSIVDSFDFGNQSTRLNTTDSQSQTQNGKGDEEEPVNHSSSMNQSIINPFDNSDLCNSSFFTNLKNFKSPPQSILTPIHTKEQLDALLSEDREKLALSSSDPRFFYLHKGMRASPPNESPFETSMQPSDLLETGGASLKISGDGRIYMISPNSEVRGENNEVLDFRAQLNESRDSLSGRRSSVNRRRRSVSPEQHPPFVAQAAATGIVDDLTSMEIEATKDCELRSMLSEIDMNLCEPRLRIWIVRTILEPILKAASETNQELAKTFANLHLRIGVSTLESLRMALKMNNRLGATKLPFLLPFLEVDENQTYLLTRIAQLATDVFMEDFKWNGGGSIPKVDEESKTSRLLPPGWQSPLPTDAQLIFKLFTAYMDTMIASSTFTQSRLNRPFTSRYILDLKDNRLQAYQSISAEYYFRMTTLSPPQYDFLIMTEKGRPVRLPIPPGEHNLFRCILSFVNHVKVYYDSTVSQVEIGRGGINLECVINRG